MADDAGEVGIDHLLRDLRRGARLRLIVLFDEDEAHDLAVQAQAHFVRLLDGKPGTERVVPADMGERARHRRHVRDAHDLGRL